MYPQIMFVAEVLKTSKFFPLYFHFSPQLKNKSLYTAWASFRNVLFLRSCKPLYPINVNQRESCSGYSVNDRHLIKLMTYSDVNLGH